MLLARGPRLGNPLQANRARFRKSLHHSGAPQQFEVIKPLVAGNVAGFRRRDGVCQEPTAEIAIVADTFRDFRQPGQQRCIESILQQNGRVEAFSPQDVGKFAPGRSPCRAV